MTPAIDTTFDQMVKPRNRVMSHFTADPGSRIVLRELSIDFTAVRELTDYVRCAVINEALWIDGEIEVSAQIAQGKVSRGYTTVEELLAALDRGKENR